MEAEQSVLDGEGDFGRENSEVDGQRRVRDWVVVSFITRDWLVGDAVVTK